MLVLLISKKRSNKIFRRTERLAERNTKVLEMCGFIVLNGGISSEKIMEIGFKQVMRNERKEFLGVAHYTYALVKVIDVTRTAITRSN